MEHISHFNNKKISQKYKFDLFRVAIGSKYQVCLSLYIGIGDIGDDWRTLGNGFMGNILP